VIDALADWGDKIRTTYMERAMAGVNQVAKRGAEAGAIYRMFRQVIDADPDAPVILLGDLNEDPASHTISILTQADRVWSWGSVAANGIPEQFAYLKHVYKLYDAFNLVPMQGFVRPNTHGGIGSGSTLDYVVVSNGLNPKNPRRRGEVTKVEVYDEHFAAGLPKDRSSDHAPVIATIRSVDGMSALPWTARRCSFAAHNQGASACATQVFPMLLGLMLMPAAPASALQKFEQYRIMGSEIRSVRLGPQEVEDPATLIIELVSDASEPAEIMLESDGGLDDCKLTIEYAIGDRNSYIQITLHRHRGYDERGDGDGMCENIGSGLLISTGSSRTKPL
jgi:hypothetical protein